MPSPPTSIFSLVPAYRRIANKMAHYVKLHKSKDPKWKGVLP